MIGVRRRIAEEQHLPAGGDLLQQGVGYLHPQQGQFPLTVQGVGVVAVDDQHVILLQRGFFAVLGDGEGALHQVEDLQFLVEMGGFLRPVQQRRGVNRPRLCRQNAKSP